MKLPFVAGGPTVTPVYQRIMKKITLAKKTKLTLRSEALRLLSADNMREVAGGVSGGDSCCDMGTCPTKKRTLQP